jgi:hypothetical protein
MLFRNFISRPRSTANPTLIQGDKDILLRQKTVFAMVTNRFITQTVISRKPTRNFVAFALDFRYYGNAQSIVQANF